VAVHDLIVRAGRVVAGLASAPQTADIAVLDGTITTIGRVRDRAHRVIDADGALVIPGLVALKPPAEVAEFERNRQRHHAPGVTTTIEELPLSVDIDDVARFFQKSGGSPFLVDRGFLIPHDVIRQRVMGNKIRDQLAPSVGDLERIVDLLVDGLMAGALGLQSTLQGELGELERLLRRAVHQLSLRTDTAATISVFLNTHGRESRELLESSRVLDGLEGVDAVVVATDEPIDDDHVVSAIRPHPEGTPMAELPPGSRSVTGPGMNPLTLAHELDLVDGGIQQIALRWAAMARSFGLNDRGIIATDRRADLNVLDQVHLNHEMTDGLVSTLVAGVEIVSFNELTGVAPGRIVSRSVAEPD
jgi:N-acyl-D-aspartate/D-glutamate deacylase